MRIPRAGRWRTGGLVLSLLVSGTMTREASGQDAASQAKTLFDAGAQAYEAGQFPAAIQAFQEAYKLAQRPGIVFSMAQAHRKQYFVDRHPSHVREAVKLYRDYIAQVPQGGRRGDAVQALSELDPILEKLGAADVAPAPEKKPATRVSISPQAKDATLTLDGKPIEAGIFHEVTPLKHVVHVTAPGYFPEDREVLVPEGGIIAVDVAMREQPGSLSVTAADGADVAVDGRSSATTPLARPIELPPGQHFVAVTKRGYRPYAEDMDFGRGEAKSITVKLEPTGQRVASYALFGVAAAGIVAGGVLVGVAIYEQSQAKMLDTLRTSVGNLSQAQAAQYASDLGTRNDLRTAGAVAFGASGVIGITAVLMAVFDTPVVGQGRHDDRPKPTTPGPHDRPVDLAATPLLGPRFFGASLSAHF